jgi:hypothetical protein
MLPGNATNNLWVLDLATQFTEYLPGRTAINYNTLNLTVTTTTITIQRFL